MKLNRPWKIMPMEALLDGLKRGVPALFDPEPILFAYLFGSYAQGCPHGWSDVDIALYLDGVESVDEFYRIEMSLGVAVDDLFQGEINSDVHSINRLPLAVVGEIATQGILIYGRNEEARVDFEVMAWKKYFDFKPILDRYYAEVWNRVKSRANSMATSE
ncbi:MAG: type VII toxin-antitoxin system MntA family adenylyltransferase antitoxin [Desulfococcaceae bacterium]